MSEPLISSTLFTFLLVFLAEIGDKSQIVCMSLASRYKASQVFFGAIAAFVLLNGAAVILGASLTQFIPTHIMTAIASGVFFIFGIQALLAKPETDDEDNSSIGKSIFISTLLIIVVAEFGDKTQLAVATLSTTENPFGVWSGASLALIATTALGVYIGQRWLTKLNPNVINKLSGSLFILFAVIMLISLIRMI
ncbi:TMEM165/GDT1 family protein [Thalassomonas sp. M1454]|uniref:TMEM165/GDT1 family protein n=1 Tax=Thalassomonas sp. M1454 TaxID=2594477 RepID=UPI00117D30BD|nr:TMEM165/GDT1 family protein [Thalassomonas sp. M1454]TRX57319.1 TMEM165/GDT1 family protein [Thalassomonas sp. M1454]